MEQILKDIFGDDIEDYCEFISGTVDVVDLTTTDDHELYGTSSNAIKRESDDMRELVETDTGCEEENGNNREEDLFSANESADMRELETANGCEEENGNNREEDDMEQNRKIVKKYLQSHLNISKMYEFYKEKQNQANCVSYGSYGNIFKTHNLKFKPPQIDTCSKCDIFKMKIGAETDDEAKRVLLEERNHHQRLADIAYEVKKADKCYPNKTVLCFDLQQCLPTPFLKSSISFYKRSLWTFNLTIRNCSTGKTYCFMWDESVSGRGPNEIASCLWNFFKKHKNEMQKNVVLYSDTCPGQNRNMIVWAMFNLLLMDELFANFTIEHKFLEPGHTHLECDSDHALIEKAKKTYTAGIWHPYDWIQLIRSCRKRNPFVVYEMTHEHIYDFKEFNKKAFKRNKVNILNEKVDWRQIRNIKYTKEHFGELQYKTHYEGPYTFASMQKGKSREKVPDLKLLRTTPNTITKEKKRDIIQLFNLIPKHFHQFYTNLQTNNKSMDILYDIPCEQDTEDGLF